MTRLSEGFEAGPQGAGVTTLNTIFTNSGGTAATMTFDAAAALIGAFGMKILNSSSFAYMQYLWGSAQTNQYVRFYYYVGGVPSSGQNIISQIQSGGTNRAQLTLTSAGKFNLRSPANLKASGVNVYTGKWVRLEWDLVGTVQTLRVYADANLHGTTPSEVLSPGAGSITISGFDRINFGNNAAETFNQYFDGIEIDSAASPGPYVASGPTDEAYINIGGVLTPVDCFIWNGSALIPVDPYVWTGSALV